MNLTTGEVITRKKVKQMTINQAVINMVNKLGKKTGVRGLKLADRHGNVFKDELDGTTPIEGVALHNRNIETNTPTNAENNDPEDANYEDPETEEEDEELVYDKEFDPKEEIKHLTLDREFGPKKFPWDDNDDPPPFRR